MLPARYLYSPDGIREGRGAGRAEGQTIIDTTIAIISFFPGDKELTIHVLRKCCAQTWANTLPLNVVMAFLGHADAKTTEQFYSTVDDDHYDKATEAMNDLLKTEPKKVDREKTDLKLTFSGDLEPHPDV
ncbi:MAG: hypothetical protein ACYST6_07165 [Planctomycetota bacterium]